MTRLHNFARLAVFGSVLGWGVAGWAQQEKERVDPSKPVERETRRGRERKLHDLDDPTKAHQGYQEAIRRLAPLGRILEHGGFIAEAGPIGLGASFEPVDKSLRTQLSLPAGQGLIVRSVAHGGSAFHIGLKVNDILMSLAGKPLATVADLTEQLKAAGEKDVSLEVLRAGKPITIQVKPELHVAFGPVETDRPQYQLGVRIEAIDDTLRAQLEIPGGQGLLVNEVEPGSSAEKAGLKPFDILLSVGDQALNRPEDLIDQLQKSSGKPLSFKVLRGGKTITTELTPEKRKVTAHDSARATLRALRPSVPSLPHSFDFTVPGPTDRLPLRFDFAFPGPQERQMGDLRKEMMELRRSIEQLQKSMGAKADSEKVK